MMQRLMCKYDLDPADWENANAILVRVIDEADACRHGDCEYFVIDLYHDRHAAAALRAYAASCAKTHPKLAQDLMRLAPLTGKEK